MAHDLMRLSSGLSLETLRQKIEADDRPDRTAAS
jgi:hypothetical protein